MNYIEPATLSEALAILAEEDDSRCFAGGATLVAMLNAELVEPSVLVGLRRIGELKSVTEEDSHHRIGAMSTHAQIATETSLTGNAAVVRNAARQIAHPAIRNMGTIGGSICHADPNADFPSALVAANACMEIASIGGTRIIPAAEFFLDYLETVLESGEILKAVLVPMEPHNARGKHLKFSRTHGDYATVSVSAVLQMDGERCSYCRVAIGSVGPVPLHLDEVDAMLTNSKLDDDIITGAAALLVNASDPLDDVRGSSEYRKTIIPGLLKRALEDLRDHG